MNRENESYKIEEFNIYDKEETVENCTVQILMNSFTGEVSYGWKRKEGVWIFVENENGHCSCSRCGEDIRLQIDGLDVYQDGLAPDYCPHCGALMKKRQA